MLKRYAIACLAAIGLVAAPVNAEDPATFRGKPVNEHGVIMESGLPQGFPQPGPAKTVHVREYPTYRSATVATSRANAGFWVLFQHISSNEIPMTAPVERALQTSGTADAPTFRYTSMAFLYGDPATTPERVHSTVQVQDIESHTTISYGFFGVDTKAQLRQAAAAIQATLAARPDLQAAGDYRLYAYNSPMIPRDRQYLELHLPVEPATAAPAAADTTAPEPTAAE